MADSNPVDLILDFLRKNKFTKAEAALRSELGGRPDLNGVLQKLTLSVQDSGTRSNEELNAGNVAEEERKAKTTRHIGEILKDSPTSSGTEASKELIVKEVDCGSGRNGSESRWKSYCTVDEHSKVNASVGTSDKNFTFSQCSGDAALDLYSWNFGMKNGTQNDGVNLDASHFVGFQVPGNVKSNPSQNHGIYKTNIKSGDGERRISWPGIANNSISGLTREVTELKAIDQPGRLSSSCSKDDVVDNSFTRFNVSANPRELTKECSVRTVFPFSRDDTSTSYSYASSLLDKKDGKKKSGLDEIRAAIKEEVDEVGRSLFFGKVQGSEPKDFHASEHQKEEFPRLPPVRLKSEEKSFGIHWEEKYDHGGPDLKILNTENAHLIGSFLDVPIGQELNSTGKRLGGGSWLSVSQGIAEDSSDLVSGFATIGDGLSESVDYPNEYWDSDEYEDDDDVGYTRQPIEDETWFLAHEIDYPSDNEKGTGHGSIPDPQERAHNKNDEDDQSFAEEDSYFSGERYFQSKNVDAVVQSDDTVGLSATHIFGKSNGNDLINQYDGDLMDEEELNLMRAEPVWQGFVTQTDELIMLGDGKVVNERGRMHLGDVYLDEDQHGSVRSIGVGINSDAADIGSEVRESLVGGSSEGDIEYFNDHDVGISSSRSDLDKSISDRAKKDIYRTMRHNSEKYMASNDKFVYPLEKKHVDGGFSFPPPRDGQFVPSSSGKSLWSNRENAIVGDENDECSVANEEMLALWGHKSSGSSTVKSSRDENLATAGEFADSSPSSLSNYDQNKSQIINNKGDDAQATAIGDGDVGTSLEDEEAAAVQEQVKQIQAQEEEFETFYLKIVHRKNRTGFEEDKNFHVVLNSVLAGRYHVTEYLGSAAFSKAIQAHDLHTGIDVCVKIIKNNKDFFDQSLDEIKLLKYVNKHDPADKYHILRLYDYFYYREHLLIVCELLKANLYEFHKFNRESGGEVYFTMPRLQ
ncbi:hypothetical protein M569_09384, partial [Genlisea aurea]